MAERLPSWDFSGKHVTAGPKYPYSQWLDGSVWKLKRGKDFDCTITSLRSGITKWVDRHMRGASVQSQVVYEGDDTFLVIQAARNVPRGRRRSPVDPRANGLTVPPPAGRRWASVEDVLRDGS